MDDQAEYAERMFLQNERAKLELLDLTDDVIELILSKKRLAFSKAQQEKKLQPEIPIDIIPNKESIPELSDSALRNVLKDEEPTFYPPTLILPLPLPATNAMDTPVLPEKPIDRTLGTSFRWSVLRRCMIPIN